MRANYAVFSKSLLNTTSMLVLTKALIKTFLCLGQSGPQEARFVDEMSWEASSTITTDSLQLWYLA
jgi:hypothetical protein